MPNGHSILKMSIYNSVLYISKITAFSRNSERQERKKLVVICVCVCVSERKRERERERERERD